MGKVMLEVRNLKTKYVTRFHEDVYAVDGVSFEIEEGETLMPAIPENRDLGIMLYDMDFSDPKNIQAMFFRAQMRQGMIIVPPTDSEEILR